MMKLKRFRVRDFRSVKDSGWIDASDVTALIGTNESGKTNLLVPLWKLNPARGGKVNPIQDFPRDRYHSIREMKRKPVFIEAVFSLPDDLAEQVSEIARTPISQVTVSRDLDGRLGVAFPDVSLERDVPTPEVVKVLRDAEAAVNASDTLKTEDALGLKETLVDALRDAWRIAEGAGEVAEVDTLRRVRKALDVAELEKAPKTSTMVPRHMQATETIDKMIARVSHPAPAKNEEIVELIEEHLPSFVYYSHYGNLDSEIYLPHVIENLSRAGLGMKEEAKVRTLRVLFDFVRLDPAEIHKLGQDPRGPNNGPPTESQIEETAERKKERDVLLQSASTSLTAQFREWWRQGNYRFRFAADGDHFRIWVSDDLRPEDIELESRSTGLQWFLSFFLVFLVESTGDHEGAILLLDEPGLSLHPLAQKDLSKFFDSLSETNQLLYTTHSPFLVDPDHLDRVKAVYVNDEGDTEVSADLRASERGAEAQSRSIYPVYAALGLSVSDTLLEGCQVVVVEGQSDQVYLSAIKNYLIGRGLITPAREILFIPSGGVKGIGAVTAIVTGKDEALPFVVVDSDGSGRNLVNKLKSSLYAGQDDRILLVGDLIGMDDSEIEDLFPAEFLAKVAARYLPRPSGLAEDFDDAIESGKPIVPQIEAFVREHQLGPLELGWKVEVAKQAKARLLGKKGPRVDDETERRWTTLFERIQA